MKVGFLLPCQPGGGGVHSVVQEAIALARMGVGSQVIVPADFVQLFRTYYGGAQTLHLVPYSDSDSLSRIVADLDVAVATIFASVATLDAARKAVGPKNGPKLGYYVQDYEPLFCQPESPTWHRARESYEKPNDTLLFAKTRWLCDQVAWNHHRAVEKIEPSLDHDVYYPRLGRARSRVSIAAMLRPSTPRRAPVRTARILNWLATDYPKQVDLHVFGCEASGLSEANLKLAPEVKVHGFLRRESVAELLRYSDFFLDLSDYQAFGRTGLEAMACGCVPVMPSIGGAREFIEDGVNGFLTETTDDESIRDLLRGVLDMGNDEIVEMSEQALMAASEYSVPRTAVEEYVLFSRLLAS